MICPSLRFQTADGRTVEFQNGVGSNAPPQVGDEVTVYCDPERPEEAKLSVGSTFRPNLKLLPVVFGIFLAMVALMFLSVFALVVWVSCRSGHTQGEEAPGSRPGLSGLHRNKVGAVERAKRTPSLRCSRRPGGEGARKSTVTTTC